MKEVKAYVRVDVAPDVVRALGEGGFCCMTIIDVSVLGQLADPKESRHSMEFVEKCPCMVRIEFVCKNIEARKMVQIIQGHGCTDHAGDGIILEKYVEQRVTAKGTLFEKEGLRMLVVDSAIPATQKKFCSSKTQGQQEMMGNNQMMGSGENMNSMMGSLNTMGKNLQDLMGQMNTMMENKSLMENPGIKKNLEQMKSHMGSAMKSMDGLSCSLRSLW